jgi:hypothetical protein
MNPAKPESSPDGERHLCRGVALLVGLLIALSGCDRQDAKTYSAAREYFYGAQGQPGYLVSSWKADRSTKLSLRRAGYGLSDEWNYLDEELNVTDLGRNEYFFRYSIYFKNLAADLTFIREESYYSIGDELWQPVPLTTRSYTVSANGRVQGSPVVQALWKCDFDAFLEGRDVSCARQVPSGQ